MSGKPAPELPVRVPAAGLVARKSSDILAVKHPGVAKSLRYIGHEPIGVEDLVRVAGMSRSDSTWGFLSTHRPSARQRAATCPPRTCQKLLTQTTAKMYAITEMCGNKSAKIFWFAFKKATGTSPKQFQAAMRPHYAGEPRPTAKPRKKS